MPSPLAFNALALLLLLLPQGAALLAPPPIFSANLSTSTGIVLGVSILSTGLVGVSTFSYPGGGSQVSSQAPALSPLLGNSSGVVGSTSLGLGPGLPSVTPLCLSPQCTFSQASPGGAIAIHGLAFFVPGSASPGAPFASETWVLSVVNATALSWVVSRTYAQGGALGVSRQALALTSLGPLQPILGPQVPSFRDASMFLNETSKGGYSTGLFDGASELFEFLAPTPNQPVRFSPSASIFRFASSPAALFSFANTFGDGTTQHVSLGFEHCDPRAAPRQVQPGEQETLTLLLNQVSTDFDPSSADQDPFPRIGLSLPDAALLQKVGTLAAVQFMHKGWIFGNNAASSPCLHEMAWFPLIHSLFDAESSALLAKELSFFASCGWQSEDYNNTVFQGAYFTATCDLGAGAAWGLSQRYSSAGFYQCPWGPLQDQNPMFPIAVLHTYLSTGNMEWLRSLRPALDAMAQYLAKRGLQEGGVPPGSPVVYRSPGSGLGDKGRHSTNWYGAPSGIHTTQNPPTHPLTLPPPHT